MRRAISHVDRNTGNNWAASDLLLRDAIKEVYCEPVSINAPFGKLKHAYLKLDTVLYPWYIRRFCPTAKLERGSRKDLRNKDIYIKRPGSSVRCTTEIPELEIDGSAIELHPDVYSEDGQIETEIFSGCNSNSAVRCWLTRIYLLHAMGKTNSSKTLNVFLLLKRIPPANGMPNCYERFGFVTLKVEGPNPRTWDDMIRGKLEPRKEEFWLF